jgi:hypothetical protein
MLRGACLRVYHQTPAEVEAQLDMLAAMGATSVAIVVSHYMRVEYNAATGDNEIAFAPANMGITNKSRRTLADIPRPRRANRRLRQYPRA